LLHNLHKLFPSGFSNTSSSTFLVKLSLSIYKNTYTGRYGQGQSARKCDGHLMCRFIPEKRRVAAAAKRYAARASDRLNIYKSSITITTSMYLRGRDDGMTVQVSIEETKAEEEDVAQAMHTTNSLPEASY
jgi:hypothetical protein